MKKFKTFIFITAIMITSALFGGSKMRTILFDDFEDGDLAAPQWRNGNVNYGTEVGYWSVIADPVDASNQVLQSGPDQRTHSINVTGVAVNGRDMAVSFRINASQAGDQYWKATVTLLLSTSNSSSEAGCGYGITVGSNTIRIKRFDGFGSEVILSEETVSLLAEWNKVSLSLSPNGTLTATLNEQPVLTVVDRTYASKFARLYISNFLNNNSPDQTGKVLFYDDVRVQVGNHQTTFQDSFDDGELGTPLWRNKNFNTGNDVGGWTLTSDPQLSPNLVLMSSPYERTHSINADCENQPFEEIMANWRFNTQDADAYWYTQFAFLLSDSNSGEEAGCGYAVRIGAGTVGLWRLDGFYSETLLAQGTASLNPNWNNVSFSWYSGTLSASINGGPPLIAHDSELPLKVSRFYITNFLNNNAAGGVTGKVIYYDDFQVEMSNGSIPFSPPPEVGVHPRILISPDDLPELRYRLAETDSGIAALSRIRSWLNCIHNGGTLYAAYRGLVDGNLNAMSLAPDGESGWWADQMSLCLSLEAFDLLIEPDAVRGEDLAKALTTFALTYEGLIINWESSMSYDYQVDFLFALAYDYAYDYLNSTQRNTVRNAIADATANQEYNFDYLPPHRRRFNKVPLYTGMGLAALAIEGETGYNSSLYSATIEMMQDFLDYGIYASGTPIEGMHYYNYGMSRGALTLVALAKRGNYLLSHPNYIASRRWYINSVEPFGHAFSCHHDAIGSSGGVLPNYAVMNWGMAGDPVFDYVWHNRVHDDYSGFNYRNDYMTVALFASDVQDQGTQGLALSNTYYAQERGLLITRSDWTNDALVLHFECRPDVYGPSHAHSDRNNFTLSALGRQWAIDRGFHISKNEWHSTVLIDGKGQGNSGPSGQVIACSDTPDVTQIAGDASYAYNYMYTFKSRINNPENQGYEWEPETKPDVVSFFSEDPTNPDLAPWETDTTYTYRTPWNEVDYACRTAALARGENPYVVIADDIRKDNNSRTYKWIMQVAGDLVVESVDSSQIILCDPNGTQRLLVRILKLDGTLQQNPFLEEYQIDAENYGAAKRVVIESSSVAERFKILLLPYQSGEVMPSIVWESTSVLRLQWPTYTDRWTFDTMGNRTTMSFDRQ